MARTMVATKNPAADLKLQYGKVMRVSYVVTFLLHVAAATMFPEFTARAQQHLRQQIAIENVDIPKTTQIKRPPPPPRPAVPIETESTDVPDDVTIESTELPLDDSILDLPPPPPPGELGDGQKEEQEEILEFYAVETVPKLVTAAPPVYPEIARKAGLEGKVFVQFIVDRNGHVKDPVFLKGPEIFRAPALDAIVKYVFKPAIQNDKAVQVRMTQIIIFKLQ